MLIALTRAVPPAITACQLTHLERRPIDIDVAVRQHEGYERALAELGCVVRRIDPAPELPDSVFVEDTAVVLDEVAVIARPGAESRRAEVDAVAEALAAYRPLLRLQAPATLDGGDVLRVGRDLYVGLSGRTDGAAVDQLQGLLGEFGYAVHGVPVTGCLHLKSAVTQIAESTVLLNPLWIDRRIFNHLDQVHVHPDEPSAGNVLLIEETLLFPRSFPRTRERLVERGLSVRTLEVGELAKAEGALTCCSLIFTTSATPQADPAANDRIAE